MLGEKGKQEIIQQLFRKILDISQIVFRTDFFRKLALGAPEIVPCESTAKDVSFEWSLYRISSTDSKVRTSY